MAMRIVQLNPFYFPYAGGIERRIRATGQALQRRGHDVHVVTAALRGATPGATDEDGVHVHRLPSRFRLGAVYNPPLVSSRGLPAALADIDPDIVDYHFRWAPSYHRAFAGHPGARVVTYHNTYGEGHGALGLASRINDRAYMKHVRAAARVVCVSRFLADDLVAHGARAADVRVVPNGIHAAAVEAVPSGRAACTPESPYVVATGRLVGVKGLDTVVRALPAVPGVHAVFAGQGPAARPLRRLAARLGVGDRVHLPGWIEEDEKIRLLRGALAYTHPARFEAFGISVLEALAAGTPVIAARTGGVPEVVGDAGLLLGHRPEAWSEAIARVANEPALREDLRLQGRVRARRFDWDRVSRDLETVYEEAIHAAA